MGTSSPQATERPIISANAEPRVADTIMFFDVGDSPVLRQRLRRLAPEKAAALCELFRGRDVLVLDGTPALSWRFSPAPAVVPPAALLRGAREELALGIAEDGLRDRLGEQEWWDYEGEFRLYAWMLAHNVILESLGALLREPLAPHALNEAALPLSGPPTTPPQSQTKGKQGGASAAHGHLSTSVLAFTVTSDDGRTTTGTISMSSEMVSRLASHPGWRRVAPAYEPWRALPGRLRIELRANPFPRSELIGAETGDVLVLGRRGHCWSRLHVASVAARSDARLQTWTASYDGDQLTIRTVAPDTALEAIMAEQPTQHPATNTPPAPSGVAGPGGSPAGTGSASQAALERVPVLLDFDLGSLPMPLGELAALRPGYVFKLPSRLEEARVVIRANGVPVGHGELVAVGDVLGVQLLAIETDGIR